MTIPDAAIEAAVPEVQRVVEGWMNYDDGDWQIIARAAIEAAMPAIREAIAQEIEAIPYSPELENGDNGEWMQAEAARTARAAK